MNSDNRKMIGVKAGRRGLAILMALMLGFSVLAWNMPVAKAEEPLPTEESTPTPELTAEPTPQPTVEPTSTPEPAAEPTPEPTVEQLYRIKSIVSFTDTNLKQALIDAGIDTNEDGEITESEMASLTGVLDLSDKGIANLSGLEYAINLTGLYLDNNNNLTSISNLSPLSKLSILSLHLTGVSDLSVVTNFQSLVYLDVSRSYVIDLSPLSGLLNLETLLLDATDVNSLIPIQGKTSLKKLDLGSTKVRDITALSSLTNLTYLDISYDYLSSDSISNLEPLTKLEYLDISNNGFYNSTPLNGMHNLKELNADYCNFTDITALSNMYNLEVLDLKYCNITDIDVLADKTSLKKLDIYDNYLNPNDINGDMAVLAGIKNVIGADNQYKIEISYAGGLYGTPQRPYDTIYYGDTVILPALTFDGSFFVDGWDIDGDGTADAEAGTKFCAEPAFVSNHYNATYNAIYQRDFTWPSGSGTEQDPYLVSTPQQVNEMRYTPNACYLLTNDIDMSAITSENGEFYYDGGGWIPIDKINGILDGDGYEIRGLSSSRIETSFIVTLGESASIKNLKLYDVNMLGEDGADGLCFENNGIISNCSVSGYIAQTTGDIGNSSYDAGIAGVNYGTVSNCRIEGTVTALSDSNLVGGTVAYNGGLVENSCNKAIVWADRTTGGIAARNMAKIIGCYNTGTVFSDDFECGGIAGDNYFGAEISDCYNVGRVYEDTAGGIAGKSGGNISNCYNIGSVQGKSIVDEIYYGTVTNCYAIERANDIIETNAGVSHVISLTNDQLESSSWNGNFSSNGNELTFVATGLPATVAPHSTTTFGAVIYAVNLMSLESYTISGYRIINITDLPAFWVLIVLSALWGITLIAYIVIQSRTRVYRKRQELDSKIIIQSMNTLTSFIDAKDNYTKGHSTRVAAYTAEIAHRMKMDPDKIKQIYYIALMHDCGKISIPDSVLKKPGKLTDDEYSLVKSHTTIGDEMLLNFTAIPDIRDGAHYHHERYDGTGYPAGLVGSDIPLCARIICIADAFDAMSSNRCYRSSLRWDEILRELKQNAGKQFDPDLVHYMIELIEDGFVAKTQDKYPITNNT